MDYGAQVAALAGTYPDLASELSTLLNLEYALGWIRRRGLSLAALDLVAQDEFSHDLLIPLAAGGPWIVFGVT
jgi:hypothetical protein